MTTMPFTPDVNAPAAAVMPSGLALSAAIACTRVGGDASGDVRKGSPPRGEPR